MRRIFLCTRILDFECTWMQGPRRVLARHTKDEGRTQQWTDGGFREHEQLEPNH
jgi:hypothetical protein